LSSSFSSLIPPLSLVSPTSFFLLYQGHATAQAVSGWLRPGFNLRSGGICGGQNATGAGFMRVLPFPLPILIPPTAPHSLIILLSTLFGFDTYSIVK
jgi:hypothetical protein